MTRVLMLLSFLLGLPITSAFAGPVLDEERVPVASLEELKLEIGAKVRLVRMDGQELRGRLVELGDTEISVSTQEGVTVLPEANVFRVYEVEGRRGKGAFRGLLVGLGITAALGTATMTQATESGEGGLGFGIGLLFAVPISVGVGAILSPDHEALVYESAGFVPAEPRAPPEKVEAPRPVQPPITTPAVEPVRVSPERPRIPRSFYFAVSGGPNYVNADFPGSITESPGSSTTYAIQAKFRASHHWGFGAEYLVTETGTWQWEKEDQRGSESRKIEAPGFKVFYYPSVGKHELVFNGGVSAFKQDAVQTFDSAVYSSAFTEDKLDPYFNLGVEYHYYVHRHIGIGGELQYYTGTNIPDPLVRFSVSLSFRTTPPPER